MNNLINRYLLNDNGDIEIPATEEEKIKLARDLLGLSIVKDIDYWLNQAKDKIENKIPKEPFLRDNENSRRDKYFRDVFSNVDKEKRDVLLDLINATVTGTVFSLLVNFDQFRFGELTLSLKPKSIDQREIVLTSTSTELHDELSEWIYSFSKFKGKLVVKEEGKLGISYRLI